MGFGEMRNVTARAVITLPRMAHHVSRCPDPPPYRHWPICLRARYSMRGRVWCYARPPLYGATPDVQYGATTDVQYGTTADVQYGATTDVQHGASPDVQHGGSTDVEYGGTTDVEYGGTTDVEYGGSAD
eukprot:3932586-Rhodomonas_salina.1